MIFIPAIDLMGGKVVRLSQGKKDSAIIYSDRPQDVAKRWQDMGAQFLHLIDLDAAFGIGDNLRIIEDIIGLGLKVQVGGGIRDMAHAARLATLGVQRIIIGTRALDEEFLDGLLAEFYYQLAVSVDARGNQVAVNGWLSDSGREFFDVMKYLAEKKVRWVIYTDINRDGGLCGPNIEQAKTLKDFQTIEFMLSGGVSSLTDLARIKKELPFLYGIISGKALYEDKIDLKAALETLK